MEVMKYMSEEIKNKINMAIFFYDPPQILVDPSTLRMSHGFFVNPEDK